MAVASKVETPTSPRRSIASGASTPTAPGPSRARLHAIADIDRNGDVIRALCRDVPAREPRIGQGGGPDHRTSRARRGTATTADPTRRPPATSTFARSPTAATIAATSAPVDRGADLAPSRSTT